MMIGLLLSMAVVGSVAAKKPHVMMVVVDDLGFDDVEFRSHQINTPNVNWLASNGVILDQYYVQCVCSPTRATFLSGRIPLYTGIDDWIKPQSAFGLPLNLTTLADKFTASGYESHAVGKWHLGFYKWDYTPTFRGFSSFKGFYSGGEDYYSHMSSGGYDFRFDRHAKCGANCSQLDTDSKGKYSTTVFSERAVEIIEQHNTETPLFLYLAYQAVHSPAQVPSSYVEPYANRIANSKRRTFAGMLSCMDEGLGNVTRALRAKGMMDDIVIVFTTDNGGPTTTGDGVGAQNLPLRGGKHAIYEGGTRGTAVLYSTALRKRNYTNTNMMHAADWFPTLLTAADIPYDDVTLDGVSQWDSIANNGPSVRNEIIYGWNDDPVSSRALRKGQYKLIRPNGGTPSNYQNYSAIDSSSAAHIGNGQCVVTTALCLPGGDIDQLNCDSVDRCCSLCLQNPKCDYWTLNNNKCFLKSDSGKTQNPTYDDHCVSGSGQKSVPAHNNTHMLFDLSVDPSEHFDIAGTHSDIVTELDQLLTQIESTGIPQATDDPACGPHKTFPVDPIVGKYWGPWC